MLFSGVLIHILAVVPRKLGLLLHPRIILTHGSSFIILYFLTTVPLKLKKPACPHRYYIPSTEIVL